MTAMVPGKLRRDARPPIEMDAAPAPGTVAALRPTVVPRPWIRAVPRPSPAQGHHPTDPAVPGQVLSVWPRRETLEDLFLREIGGSGAKQATGKP